MSPPKQDRYDEDPAPKRSGRILVVDEEVVVQALLAEVFGEEGYDVTVAEDGVRALELLRQRRFDVVVTDMVMPRKNGIDVLLAAKQADPGCPVIMITGYPSVDTAVRLVNLGVTEYITKPFNVDLIKVTVAKVLEMRKVRRASGGDGLPGSLSAGNTPTEPYGPDLFRRMLEKEIGRSGWRGHVCSLLVARAERINGASGQQRPDALALAVRREARPGDTVGRTAQTELALILPETDRTGASALGESLRRRMGADAAIFLGVASFPNDAPDAGGLIESARATMQTRGSPAVGATP